MNIDDFACAPDYAANYLRTFFMGKPTLDEEILVEFLVEEYSKLLGIPRLLELGCGPVVHHAFAATPHVSEIHMADLREDNLAEIQKWLDRDPNAHDWQGFTQLALKAEGTQPPPANIAAREDAARACITRLSRCDLRRPHPLGEPVQFPAVACFYTTEQAATDRESWQTVFANLLGLVAPMGHLFCCAIGYTDHYVLRDAQGHSHRYRVPRLTETDFQQALLACGFPLDQISVSFRTVEGQEDEGVVGVILVSAQRRAESHP